MYSLRNFYICDYLGSLVQDYFANGEISWVISNKEKIYMGRNGVTSKIRSLVSVD